MEIEEMGILDNGFRILFLFKVRFSSFHDDVGVIVLFNHRIAQENLFIRAVQDFLRRILRFRCAGAGSDETEHPHEEADGCCKP